MNPRGENENDKAAGEWNNTNSRGQRVIFGSPLNRKEGIVIEDRGPLGVGGKQIVRIRYYEDFSGAGQPEPVETETEVENVEMLG